MKPQAALEQIRRRLTQREPQNDLGQGVAAVAVVFRETDGTDLLLMKRTERDGDPWSGQVAFPGGRVEMGDRSLRDAAIRETEEEMGFSLGENSLFLGYLGLFEAKIRKILVVPSIFVLGEDVRIQPNSEVSGYRWVPFKTFRSEGNRSVYLLRYHGETISFPSFVVDDYVIWGLTERIISEMISFL